MVANWIGAYGAAEAGAGGVFCRSVTLQHALFVQQPGAHCFVAHAPPDFISTGSVTCRACVANSRLTMSVRMSDVFANMAGVSAARWHKACALPSGFLRKAPRSFRPTLAAFNPRRSR